MNVVIPRVGTACRIRSCAWLKLPVSTVLARTLKN